MQIRFASLPLVALLALPGQRADIATSDAVRQAEALGAVYAGGDRGPQQAGFDGQADSGTRDRKCVAVGEGDIVQSGDIVAGSFTFFRSHWQLNGVRKLWWAPRYLPAGQARSVLAVQATPLDQPGGASSYRRDAMVRDGKGLYFFNTDFGLPDAGRWLIVATSGPNWGCFIVVAR